MQIPDHAYGAEADDDDETADCEGCPEQSALEAI